MGARVPRAVYLRVSAQGRCLPGGVCPGGLSAQGVSAQWGCLPGGVVYPGGCLLGGVVCPGGCLPKLRVSARGVSAGRYTPPREQNDRRL